MKEPHILMKDFELKTYESQCSYPEIELHASFIFPMGKPMTHIDIDALKNKLMDELYSQVVKVESLQTLSPPTFKN